MSTIATAPHECEGNLNYVDNGLSPYWFVGNLLTREYDGHGELLADIDGEPWTITLTYQKGGIAPRAEDPIDSERLYEYRIGMYGRGQRKINFHIRPRFAGMKHFETGAPIESPFDNDNHPSEGVSVRFAASNLEPETIRTMLPRALQLLAGEVGAGANVDYFTTPYETSNITTYEVYVRLARSMAEKVTRTSGVMKRLFHLLADREGGEVVLKLDNQQIIGYNHRLLIPKEYAGDLVPGHRLGKQIKHYHPKHVRSQEKSDDPLYHPKIGVLFKKSLTGRTVAWERRAELRRELDELLVNLLDWAGVPTKPTRRPTSPTITSTWWPTRRSRATTIRRPRSRRARTPSW